MRPLFGMPARKNGKWNNYVKTDHYGRVSGGILWMLGLQMQPTRPTWSSVCSLELWLSPPGPTKSFQVLEIAKHVTITLIRRQLDSCAVLPTRRRRRPALWKHFTTISIVAFCSKQSVWLDLKRRQPCVIDLLPPTEAASLVGGFSKSLWSYFYQVSSLSIFDLFLGR